MFSNDDLLTIREFAAKVHYSERQIRQLCIDGKILASKDFGRKWLIPATELQRLAAKSREETIKELKLEKERPQKEIVLEAQRRHLAKVRTRLLEFSEYFKEIDLKRCVYYIEYQPIDEQMRHHLPDNSFWQNVDSFKEKSDVAKTIYDELYEEIKSKAESEIGSLDDSDSGGIHVTSNFVTTVVELAVNICLGQPDDHHGYEWIPSVSKQTYGGNFISAGIPCKTKHRELVEAYPKDKRCGQLATTVKDLRLLRVDILKRIEVSVDNEEYIHYSCSRCHR